MSETNPTHWTDRTASFVPHVEPDTDRWESLFDSMVEHYMDAWWRRFFGPTVSGEEDTIVVSGLPWWMPGWVARRTVARLALQSGLGGDAEYKVRRAVLA